MKRNRKFLRERDAVVHVYNRGANRGQIFHRKRDYEVFMQLLLNALRKYPVTLIAYTLMPNHFHLVLHQHEPFAISHFMKAVSQSYAQWLNRRLGRSGPLFERRYGGIEISDPEGLLRVIDYVHRNAEEAGLVPTADKWPYSSCRDYLYDQNVSLENGRTLVWALVGGVEGYKHFHEHYVAACPASAAEYLRPESADIWLNKRKDD